MELVKGLESLKSGGLTADELDAELKRDFDI